MKIMILGADGFYGGAVHDYFEKKHDLLSIDNFWRRKLKYPSLIPLRYRNINYCDITNYDSLHDQFNYFNPDTVIHLAEQRSAPFSMLSLENKNFTLTNNLQGTLNVLECCRQYNSHLIHIGSMGVYGYEQNFIKEGDNVRNPGSIYHLSKCNDNLLFKMYNKMYNMDITELHQGIIWGIGGRFDYDSIFGTVLNRFIVQSLIDHPLTLYGQGNQERAFINIQNSIDCLELVLDVRDGFQEYNQYTEIIKLNDLKKYFNTDYINVSNPRIEKEDNLFDSSNTKLKNLGLKEILISKTEIDAIKDQLKDYTSSIDENLILPNHTW